MQTEQKKPIPYATLADMDENVFAGRRGFPLHSIGKVVAAEEVLSTNGDTVIGFILEEDDNDIYMFMPAEVKTVDDETQGRIMGLTPYGYSPVVRINRRTVQDVTPIFYEKEQVYYHFVVNNVHDVTPEGMHPKMDRWIVYLTQRVQAAKTSLKRSVYRDEYERELASDNSEVGIVAPDELSPEEIDEIVKQIKAEHGEDVEIKFASSIDDFEALAGLEEGSMEEFEKTGAQPKKKVIH